MVGEFIGQYRLVRQLGEGGMGAVFEAVHEQLGRRAAIKMLHPEVSARPELARRFFNEARAANVVRHRGIVDVYEFGQTGAGAAYIIMEYLEGETLSERLERLGGRLKVDQALRLVRQIASALAAAHAAGIVHRDLKPANVMIVRDPEAPAGERATILDFGVAKLTEEPGGMAELSRTRTGMTLGTPVYMAPEQGRGARDVDGKADVYSLGVMCYEALAGRPPFLADTATELIAKHMYEQPPQLRQLASEVPEELASLVHRMLAKDGVERPAMDQIISELEQLGAPRAISPVPGLAPQVCLLGAAVQDSAHPGRATLGEASAQSTVPRRHPPGWLVAVAAGVVLVCLVWFGVRPRQHGGSAPVQAGTVAPASRPQVLPREPPQSSPPEVSRPAPVPPLRLQTDTPPPAKTGKAARRAIRPSPSPAQKQEVKDQSPADPGERPKDESAKPGIPIFSD